MPLSLRKACHACVKSKRRCIPQLPSCDRCAKKQISCVYDLEPVSQGETLSAGEQDVGRGGSGSRDVDANASKDTPDFKIVYSSVKSAREASMIAIANGHDATSPATRPKMFGSAELTQWVVNFFIDVARDGAAGKGTPFAHRHIFQTRPEDDNNDEPTTKTQYFTRLISIHDQMIHLLPLLLNKSTNKSDATLNELVTTFFTTTHNLWSSPPTHFDTSFTPWESWLTAETIRRSIFAAQILKGLYSFVRHGYVPYEPFFESFPFDPRAGLWEAQTKQDWETVLRKYGGVHTRLKSYNEFVMGPDGKGEGSLNPDEDGAFQRLLFLCFHCDTGLKHIRELELR